MLGQLVRRYGQILGLVRHDVEVHRDLATGIEVDAAEIAAGVERGIDQRVQRRRLERQGAVGRLRRRRRFQRRRVLPAGRQLQRRLHGDASGEHAGGVENDGVPGEIDHVRRHIDAAFALGRRRQILEADIERFGALRQLQVERVHVHHIAQPLDALAVSLDDETGEIGDRAGWAVIAWHEARVEQDQVAVLGGRSCVADRDGFVHLDDVAGEIGRIDIQLDLAGPRDVLRIGDRGRLGERLGLLLC